MHLRIIYSPHYMINQVRSAANSLASLAEMKVPVVEGTINESSGQWR